MRIIGVVVAAIFGVVTFSAPLIAQQKTEKACQEEWRANKAANQAKGITEQAYVTKCISMALPQRLQRHPRQQLVLPPQRLELTNTKPKLRLRRDVALVRLFGPISSRRSIILRVIRTTDIRKMAHTCVKQTQPGKECALPKMKSVRDRMAALRRSLS